MEQPLKAKLLYVEEHLSCRRYLKEINTGFIYREFKKSDRQIAETPTTQNHLVVVLKGRIRVDCEMAAQREVGAGEMFVIARSSVVYRQFMEDTHILLLKFDYPTTNCDKLNFQHLARLTPEIEYNLNTLAVKYPVNLFFELLIHYLTERANCAHLHEWKHNELFLCLRYFYSREELASLFYPILAQSIDFRGFVMDNYRRVKSVKELVGLSNMSRSVFYAKFSREFGMPAKQWLMKKILYKIAYRASEPGITVKKLMTDMDFESLPQFQVYCKRNFGCSPSELIARGAKGNIYFMERQ